MAPNDLIALKANLSHWLGTRGSGLTGIAPFNYYCIENFLKLYPVNDKEIRTGAVDQPLDGGVDAFYFFANRKYIFEDTTLDPDSEYRINLIVFQCKEGTGFSPVEVGKFVFFTEDLLDLNREESDYKALYHDRLKVLMRTFKDQYSRIAGTVTSFNIDYIYISKLDVEEPKANGDVSTYMTRLKKEVLKHFPKAITKINFVNAAKLFAQASIRKTKSKKLTYSSQTIQSAEGWIGLIELRAFYTFLNDEHGDFQEDMLEENVRGYQQKTPVNEGMALTLREPNKSAEFWVLNNGITILAEELQPAGFATLTIKDPQIVNGLQTSRNVYDYYKSTSGGVETDKRRILVRIIETKDESVRDQIIRATNSQNKMPPEALRATDPIHRKIEEVFENFGLFYDRRKGHYKDLGKPVAKIVSVREVLQATLALALRKPNDARARPADFLKDDDKYNEVFGSEKLQITTYLKCVELVRLVDAFKPIKEYQDHALNLLFYVSLCAAARALNNAHVPANLLNGLNLALLTNELLNSCYSEVFTIYEKCGGDDKAAKGTEMRDQLIEHLEKAIHGK
jgi:hypothetical protein